MRKRKMYSLHTAAVAVAVKNPNVCGKHFVSFLCVPDSPWSWGLCFRETPNAHGTNLFNDVQSSCSSLQEEENGNRCLSLHRDSQENYIPNEEKEELEEEKNKGCAQRQNCAVRLLFDELLETKCSSGTIEKDIPLWRIAFPNVSQAADSIYIFSVQFKQHCHFQIGR